MELSPVMSVVKPEKSKERRKRTFWVKPMISSRLMKGAFHTIYSELRRDERKFAKYFRMTTKTFDELLSMIRTSISRCDTCMRTSISPAERLAITLKYLGSGSTFTDLHYTFRIGISTATVIVKEVCIAIWNVLRNQCLTNPHQEQWKEIATGFAKATNFPNCIGAIDVKHVKILKSTSTDDSHHFGHRHFCYAAILAITDSNYNFTYVDISSDSNDSDTSILRTSELWQNLENNSFNIPIPEPLPGADASGMPFVLVGDEVFSLSKNLMRPYAGRMLCTKKKVFNYRLSRARRSVECTFAILCNKWKVFHAPMKMNVEFAMDIVRACCVLHNFVLKRDGYNFDESLIVEGLEDLKSPLPLMHGGKMAHTVRDEFANYFLTDAGSVSWQLDRI